MDAQTLDLNLLKALIKESVREVLREEWFNMFQVLIPYVETEEQAEIEESLGSSPTELAEEDFVDMTDWVTNASQNSSGTNPHHFKNQARSRRNSDLQPQLSRQRLRQLGRLTLNVYTPVLN